MVNKTDRFEQRTGNTIRPYVCRNICSITDPYLEIEVFNLEKGDIEYIEDTLKEFSHGVHRSFLEPLDPCRSDCYGFLWKTEKLLFSLNKKRRWLLSETVKNQLYDLAKEDFKVVLTRRNTVLTLASKSQEANLIGNSKDYVEYMDSYHPFKVYIPNKTSSCKKDLSGKLSGKTETGSQRRKKEKISEQRAGEIQRQRGVQRRVEVFLKSVHLDPQPQHDTDEPILDSNLDVPEIRYNIFEPILTSRFRPQRLYHWKFVRSRDFKKYTIVRKHNSSKKAKKKQKGNVNGRKVKYWQQWLPKELEYFTRLSSMFENDRIYKTPAKVELGEKLLEDAQKDSEYMTGSYNGNRKSAIEVNMVDLLMKCKRQQRNERKKKRWGNEPTKEFTLREGVNEDQSVSSNVEKPENYSLQQEKVVHITQVNGFGVEMQLKETSPPGDEQICDDDDGFILCRILKSEVSNFMAKSFVRRSECCFPQVVFIPLRRNLVKDGKQNTSDIFLQSGLVVQELLPSAVADPPKLIGEYTLRLHDDTDEEKWEHIKKELSMYMSTCNSSPVSLRNIYHLLQQKYKNQIYSSNEEPLYISKVDKPLFDWMTTVTYRISTIEHIFKVHFHQRENKNSSPPSRSPSSWNIIHRDKKTCVVCMTSFSIHGLCVMPCQHDFCRSCVRRFVVDRIKQGAQTLTCLEYGCKSQIDDVMILSLVPFSLYRTWERIQRERIVMSTGRWKWCPNEKCGHIVSVSERSTNDVENPSPKTLSSRQEVTCVCKTQFCVDCQGTPHWPATCNQATMYHDITNHIQVSVSVKEYENTLMKVKSCPRCRNKINKDGGSRCTLMTCRCGSYLCWACLRPVADHRAGDICQNITGQEIEFSNRMVLNLPTHNTESAISYLLAQMRLMNWKKSRFRHFSKSALRSDTSYGDGAPHSPKKQSRVENKIDAVHSLTLFIKTLKVLEYIYVSIPPIPKGVHSRRLTKMHEVGNKIEFLTKRIEQMLMDPVLHKERQKIRTLQNLLSDNLCDLYLLSTWTRQEFLSTGQWKDRVEKVDLAKIIRVFPSARRKEMNLLSVDESV